MSVPKSADFSESKQTHHSFKNQNGNSSSRINFQQQMTNGLFIRKEIQRFESVHPNIYSIYDLIDSISDHNLQQQIREHIVNIEDSFVNSQEWTLSRNVSDLRLGILGTTNSGKSSLVHRFLTGTYMQEESPEGGRFKKEVILNGQSYLLLLRDEGGQPEMQFAHWVDAVIFVFSLENEESFSTIYDYFQKMNHFRNMNDVPLILVGTQDYISDKNPRIIDDNRAKNLANELKKSIYFETCASYGLHVERVFHEACQKIINSRLVHLPTLANKNDTLLYTKSFSPDEKSHELINNNEIKSVFVNMQQQQYKNGQQLVGGNFLNQNNFESMPVDTSVKVKETKYENSLNTQTIPTLNSKITVSSADIANHSNQFTSNNQTCHVSIRPSITKEPNNKTISNYLSKSHITEYSNQEIIFKEPYSMHQTGYTNNENKTEDTLNKIPLENDIFNYNNKDCHGDINKAEIIITPFSTPSQKRKDTNRRRSNLFTPNKKEEKTIKHNDMGIGRSIPIKQGFLFKKTNSSINKDWKKKFVTLNDDGSLRYYPSMNDYMEDSHGKEIELQKTTVKIPGSIKPRIGKNFDQNRLNNEINMLNLSSNITTALNNQILTNRNDKNIVSEEIHDANAKKRHRRIKSNHKNDQNKEDELEGFEFIILSLDNKAWHFEAASLEERDEWVQSVEKQILASLQSNETNKIRSKNGVISADNDTILTMKNVKGNSNCADCDAPDPVWASLNLGALICIECSGIHRNLGTHLSRVRSLELDEWSTEYVQVMTAIGNHLLNSIYEANLEMPKPNANSSREEKEKFVRAKYEAKLFFPKLEIECSIGKELVDAVSKQDIRRVLMFLALSKIDDINFLNYNKNCLHIAAEKSNLVILQLLIWYGGDVNSIDDSGKNVLHYAKISNSMDCIQLLKFNGSIDI